MVLPCIADQQLLRTGFATRYLGLHVKSQCLVKEQLVSLCAVNCAVIHTANSLLSPGVQIVECGAK